MLYRVVVYLQLLSAVTSDTVNDVINLNMS
jgi:hypothetical protein